MITSRTKKQLIVFAIITLLGVTFVGARYARLDRLFYDSAYAVDVHYAQSGGIFTGAEVTYRGVTIGKVSKMKLTDDGVDVVLSINKSEDKIPKDSLALVGNKSAVGEQYVELQPKTDGGPYLKNGSTIDTPDTEIPVSTTEILTNLDNLVQSVPQADLRTVVAESGAAFKDAGPSLGQIIDTSSSFIKTAEANFETTTALIRDSRTVLQTQVDKGSAIRSFAKNLSLFSGTVAANDKYLRSLIDNGSATANELRTFLEQNKVNLGQLINNLVTTNEIVVQHLKGIRQILVIYPYIVAGGFTVAERSKDDNGQYHYNARFGLILTQGADVCKKGYEGTDRRSAQDTADRPMRTNIGCTDPTRDYRGAEKAPRGRAGAAYRSPVAAYDSSTGKVVWGDQSTGPQIAYDGGDAELFGQDSWKWMLLQPSLARNQE
jgi:phospholipid/cholesterol/gamma-HCH transport system substrate-binding protein